MLAFATLLDRLVLTPQRSVKLRLVTDFLHVTPDPERGWALAALTGSLSFRAAKAGLLRQLIEARVDPQLFALSYDYVGDLAETVSLMWPEKPGANRPPDLSDVIETLGAASRSAAPALVEGWLDALDASGRFALLKLVTGGLRVGLSGRLARQAMADLGGVALEAVEEVWHGQEAPYLALFAWLEGKAAAPPARQAGGFRPVMLAHPLDDGDDASISPGTHIAEWKWDGIRVQAVSEGGIRRLYTRTGEDIGAAFPDVVEALAFEGVIDGELLVHGADGAVAGFNDLQQRLNRKSVDKARMAAFPAFIRAYDLLLDGSQDLRGLPLVARRERLEALLVRSGAQGRKLDLSVQVPFGSLGDLAALRASPPDPRAEGLMLKRLDSPYMAGRPRGLWFKWKREPMVADCVLLYAQRGHGRRSSLYSDFTFGCWTPEGALVPVGKAYSGFTDAELADLDRFVRENTTERFGPVRAVKADATQGLVLEVAFEGLARSTRHKSGLAMRFPRISRIRWDKPPAQADTVAQLARFLSA
jgi:DNA ligase 1